MNINYKKLSAITLLSFMPIVTVAETNGVVFWNKMQSQDGPGLLSEVGPNLSLSGSSWNFLPAQFGNGWDNNNESSFAYISSNSIIQDVTQGAFAFWWVPDDDGDTVYSSPFGSARKDSVFFSNGATNTPLPNRYNLEFWYAQHVAPASFFINFAKVDASGELHALLLNAGNNPYTGAWQAGDKVHIAFAWHNEPVVLGQYIAVLWIDGAVARTWSAPDIGTLEGWASTNPTQAYSAITRIGDSIFPYSMDEQLRGPIDNIVFWDYAKSDFSDRFLESPLLEPPTADAGPNQSIHAGELVLLDGSGSYDDLTPTESLLFEWTFSSIPENSEAILNNPESIAPSFVADVPGDYEVQLVVTDEDGLSSEPSLVFISSLNSPPNANAGPDTADYVGNLIMLDGSASNDPDSDPLSYKWTLLTSPEGSTASLSDSNSTMPTIVPDIPGTYEIQLIVNDGFVDSSPDVLTLMIVTPEDFAQQQTAQALNLVANLQPSNTTTSGNQQAVVNFLLQALAQIQAGRLDVAITKLESAIARTDGCVLRGAPDQSGANSNEFLKDYITNCNDQSVAYTQLLAALEALH